MCTARTDLAFACWMSVPIIMRFCDHPLFHWSLNFFLTFFSRIFCREISTGIRLTKTAGSCFGKVDIFHLIHFRLLDCLPLEEGDSIFGTLWE